MSNSLAAMRPELVSEWSDKNLPLNWWFLLSAFT